MSSDFASTRHQPCPPFFQVLASTRTNPQARSAQTQTTMADETNPTSPAAASFDAGDHLSHFSNGDYDWMGVLDGCFDYHSMDGHEIHHPEGHGGTAAVASLDPPMSLGASAPTSVLAPRDNPTAPTQAEAAPHPSDLSDVTEHTAPLKSCETADPAKKPPTEEGKEAESETCPKKIDRVERKRNREKQRRLDTNSQFTTLAAIVREIETTDFVEEAQLNNLYELTQSIQEGEGEGDSKKLKSECSIQNAISAAGTYSASNRVELIARTSLMLSQFRSIRKKRNEELRDARRQNCEMKKEVEELRRMVAHYKTVGMGVQKPQDKVGWYMFVYVIHQVLSNIGISQILPLLLLDHDDGANDGTSRCSELGFCWIPRSSSHGWRWLLCSTMDANNGSSNADEHAVSSTAITGFTDNCPFCTSPWKSKCSDELFQSTTDDRSISRGCISSSK